MRTSQRRRGQRVTVPSFVRDVGFLAGAGNVRLALGLLQAVLVARWLGPHDYGRAVLILAMPELIFGIVDLRGSEASIRFLQRYRHESDGAACSSLCFFGYVTDTTVAALTLLVLFVMGLVVPWGVLRNAQDAHLAYLYAATFLVRGLAPTSLAVLTVGARYPTIARCELISSILRAVVVLASVAGGAGVLGVIVGNALFGVVRAALLFNAARATAPGLWGQSLVGRSLRPLRGRLREIVRFIALGDAAGTIAVLVKQGDVILIGSWLGPEAAGTYRIAKNLPDVVTMLSSPLQTVAFERLSALTGRGDLGSLRDWVRKFTLRVGAPICVLALASIVIVPRSVPFIAGSGYRPAVGPGSLFIASASIGLLLFWLRPLHLATGEPGVWAVGNLTSVGLYAVLGVPLLWRYGLAGCAVAFLVANVAVATVLAIRQWTRVNRWAVLA